MGAYLIVTIDTEADHQKYRDKNNPCRNTDGLIMLQNLFDKYQICPSYLITYSVATDKRSLDILKQNYRNGKCEIGAHLHPEDTPPFWDGKRSSSIRDYGKSILREKLRKLTETIEEEFERPVGFRAARYRVTDELIEMLIEEGYLVDSSVTPNIHWGLEGGNDYRHKSLEWYWCARGKNKLLEVPITIAVKGYLPGLIKGTYLKYLSMPFASGGIFPGKVIKYMRWAKPIWLRASYHSVSEMKWLVDRVLQGDDVGVQFICMMFHSYEFSVGCSPLSKTEESVRHSYNRLDRILEYMMVHKKLHNIKLGDAGMRVREE